MAGWVGSRSQSQSHPLTDMLMAAPPPPPPRRQSGPGPSSAGPEARALSVLLRRLHVRPLVSEARWASPTWTMAKGDGRQGRGRRLQRRCGCGSHRSDRPSTWRMPRSRLCRNHRPKQQQRAPWCRRRRLFGRTSFVIPRRWPTRRRRIVAMIQKKCCCCCCCCCYRCR